MVIKVNWYHDEIFYYVLIHQKGEKYSDELAEGVWKSYAEQYIKNDT